MSPLECSPVSVPPLAFCSDEENRTSYLAGRAFHVAHSNPMHKFRKDSRSNSFSLSIFILRLIVLSYVLLLPVIFSTPYPNERFLFFCTLPFPNRRYLSTAPSCRFSYLPPFPPSQKLSDIGPASFFTPSIFIEYPSFGPALILPFSAVLSHAMLFFCFSRG